MSDRRPSVRGRRAVGPTRRRPDRRSRGGRAILAALLAPLLAGCATTTTAFQEHYEAGRYDEAVSAFRADSSLHEDEEALYRLALMQMTTDSPVRDLESARRTLERLIELHPDGGRSRDARAVLSLLGQIRRLETQLKELKAVDLEKDPPDDPPR